MRCTMRVLVCVHMSQRVRERDGGVCMRACVRRLFTGHKSGVIRAWNTSTWACELELRGHEDAVATLAAWGSCLVSGAAGVHMRAAASSVHARTSKRAARLHLACGAPHLKRSRHAAASSDSKPFTTPPREWQHSALAPYPYPLTPSPRPLRYACPHLLSSSYRSRDLPN